MVLVSSENFLDEYKDFERSCYRCFVGRKRDFFQVIDDISPTLHVDLMIHRFSLRALVQVIYPNRYDRNGAS